MHRSSTALSSLLPGALLLLVAALLRLPGLDAAPVDVHHVRQADTASIARNMLREGIDLFHPRIDWAGPEAGYVESELPLYGAVVAGLWRLLGQNYLPDHRVPRLLSILCWWLGGLLLLVLVQRRLRGPPAIYLLLYAFSPLAVVFSRNIQPDSLALLLLLLAMERADRGSQASDLRALLALALAGLSMGLAIAVKGTMALFLPLVLALGLARQGSAIALRLPLLLLPPLAIGGAWYSHAHFTLGAEGASFGLWGAEAHKWGGPALWFSLDTWRSVLGAAVAQTLSPLGLLLAIRGAIVAKARPELRMYVFGALSLVLGCFVFTEGFALHNYYQLPLVPFASVLVGAALVDAAGRLAQWAALSARLKLAVLLSVLLLGTLSLQLGLGFAIDSLRADVRVAELSRGVSAVLPRKRSVVVTDRHPQTVLYAIDRRGWHRTALGARELRKLQGLGAEFLLLTDTVAAFGDPLMAAYLRLGATRHASGPGWALYKLRPAPPLPTGKKEADRPVELSPAPTSVP